MSTIYHESSFSLDISKHGKNTHSKQTPPLINLTICSIKFFNPFKYITLKLWEQRPMYRFIFAERTHSGRQEDT